MKTNRISMISRILPVAMLTLSLSLVHALPVSAASGAQILGKTYGEWSAQWWQWQEDYFPDFAFGEGTVDCALGQLGPVWFLGGTGGGEAERTCDTPIGRRIHLFIPLVNANIFNDDPLCPNGTCSLAEKREILDGIFSEQPDGPYNSVACNLQIAVDGTPAVYATPLVRTQSPSFEYGGDPETVADGYWVMLDPLPSGDHVIHFSGGICDIDTGESLFSVGVTYHVSVE